jgi:hypothetical protein
MFLKSWDRHFLLMLTPLELATGDWLARQSCAIHAAIQSITYNSSCVCSRLVVER